MCIICTGEIDENLNTLTRLNVSNCESLTSEKLQEILVQCKNLETLDCSFCTYLTSLDLRSNINLTTLSCVYCTSLTSIDLRSSEGVTSKGCVNLKTLYCYNCESLTSLDLRECKNLLESYLFNCSILTFLQYNDLKSIYPCFIGSPWISQNRNFSSNLQSLIKIQRWCKRMRLVKYMKSQEFVEWIYNPNNIGGKYCKKSIQKFLIKPFRIYI